MALYGGTCMTGKGHGITTNCFHVARGMYRDVERGSEVTDEGKDVAPTAMEWKIPRSHLALRRQIAQEPVVPILSADTAHHASCLYRPKSSLMSVTLSNI